MLLFHQQHKTCQPCLSELRYRCLGTHQDGGGISPNRKNRGKNWEPGEDRAYGNWWLLCNINKTLYVPQGLWLCGWLWRVVCPFLHFELPGYRPALIWKLKPQQCDTALTFTVTTLSAGLSNAAFSFWLMQLPDIQTSLAYIQLAQTTSDCMHHSARTLLVICSGQLTQWLLQWSYMGYALTIAYTELYNIPLVLIVYWHNMIAWVSPRNSIALPGGGLTPGRPPKLYLSEERG